MKIAHEDGEAFAFLFVHERVDLLVAGDRLILHRLPYVLSD